MTATGRVLLVAAAGVLLLLGLVLGLIERDYSTGMERTSCGAVLVPQDFIVTDADDPLLDEAARCAGEVGQAAPQVWALLGSGGTLLAVAAASVVGQAPGGRGPDRDESEAGAARS